MKLSISKILILVFSLISLAAGAQGEEEEVTPTEHLGKFSLSGRCLVRSPRYSLFPKANCESSSYSRSTKKIKVFRYNDRGLRERNIPAKAKPGEKRILLAGPLLFPLEFDNEESAATELEKSLNRISKHRVEVINGSVQNFRVWRNTAYLPEIEAAYSPDLSVYLQTAESFIMDLSERLLIELDGDGNLLRTEGSPAYIAPPLFLGWIWPSAPFQRELRSAWNRFQIIRDIRNSKKSLAEAVVGPSLEQLKKWSLSRKTLIIYDGRPVYFRTLNKGPDWLKSFTDWLAPPIYVPPRAVIRELKKSDLDFHVWDEADDIYERDNLLASVTYSAKGIQVFIQHSQSAILERLKIPIGEVKRNFKLSQ